MFGSTLLLFLQNTGAAPPVVPPWYGTMRRPSTRLTPNVVSIVPSKWSKDAAAGRITIAQSSRGPFSIGIAPTDSVTMPEHMREANVIYHTCKFYDDPQTNIRDVIFWGTRQLVVRGTIATSAARGRTWLVHCEERPPGATYAG
jgi:hypothetical protein